MTEHADSAPHRALRWLAAHVLSAAGMTVTVVLAAVATSSTVLSREYGNGLLAAIMSIGIGTAAVAGARALLGKSRMTLWLALPTAVLAANFALALVQ